VVANSEVLVTSMNDAPILDALAPLLTPEHVVLDLVGIPARERLPGRHVGLCW
jgi:hypothetical protein